MRSHSSSVWRSVSSIDPAVSITTSAIARRASSDTCEAMRAAASVSLIPRSSTNRRMRTSAGACATMMSSHGSPLAPRRAAGRRRRRPLRVGRERDGEPPRRLEADRGVHDRVEPPDRVHVPEDARPERRTIERPVGGEHRSPELGRDVGEHRRSRALHVADDLVGVDDDCAPFGEPRGDRGFTRGDATGECDKRHGTRMPCSRHREGVTARSRSLRRRRVSSAAEVTAAPAPPPSPPQPEASAEASVPASVPASLPRRPSRPDSPRRRRSRVP